jgi:Pentapeptide repeats (8 copies)
MADEGKQSTGDAWGDDISDERKAELQDYLNRWQREVSHDKRLGPFDKGTGRGGVLLTGGDVSWLAEKSRRDDNGWVPNLHLEGATLRSAHLEGAQLEGAHLEGANLIWARLEGALLVGAHLEGAHLSGANLGVNPIDRTNGSSQLSNRFTVEQFELGRWPIA